MNDMTPYVAKGFLSAVLHALKVHFRYVSCLFFTKATLMIAGVLSPFMFGRFIDTLAMSKEAGLAWNYAILLAALTLISSAGQFIQGWVGTKVEAVATYELSQSFVQRFLSVSFESTSANPPSYFANRINTDSRVCIMFLASETMDAILSFLQAVIMLAIIASLSRVSALVVAIVIPLHFLVFRLFKGRIFRVATSTKETASKYWASFQRQFEFLQFIKSNGIHKESQNFVAGYFHSSLTGLLRYRLLASGADSASTFLQAAATIVLIVHGATEILANRMTVGQFTIQYSYFATILSLISLLLKYSRSFLDFKASAARLEEIVDLPVEPSGSHALESARRIDLSGVTVHLSPEKSILDGRTFRFQAGKIYCIQGENGSGKSTLMRTILGFYRNVEGGIHFDGIDLQELDVRKMRAQHFSYVPQEPVLLFDDPQSILTLGGTRPFDAVHEELLRDMLGTTQSVQEFLASRLNAGATHVENRFSGGERQKIALAVALAKQSAVILLDEPTSALDARSKAVLFHYLKERAVESIIIFVSHDPDLIALADEVVDLISDHRAQEAQRPSNPVAYSLPVETSYQTLRARPSR